VNGKPLNDPLPDTLVDPATGNVVSPPADGPSALLDTFTITKPQLEDALVARLHAPEKARRGDTIKFRVEVKNHSTYALNGVQVALTLPREATFAGTTSDSLTVHGREVVITLGRLAIGAEANVEISANLEGDLREGTTVEARAEVRSSTALAVKSNETDTHIVPQRDDDGRVNE
jgi:uncharacterized repeat protein (TIGR01451 family)